MPSMGNHPNLFARLHKLGLTVSAAVFLALGVISLTGSAGAAKVTVLGAAAPVQPSCDAPANQQCIVEAKVTAFQTTINGARKPFVAKADGTIVAWSIKIGTPSDLEEKCFSKGCVITDDDPSTADQTFEGFNGPASARIAILKPIRKQIKQGKPIYKLLRQSPVEVLTPLFGRTTTFALRRSLHIAEGQIAAITIPTWAPLIALGQGSQTSWRASRKATEERGPCAFGGNTATTADDGANVKAGSPHQAVGKERSYACTYTGNRLLYSATLVRAPTKKK